MNPTRRTSRYFRYIEPVIKAPIVKTYGYFVFTVAALIVFVLFAIKPTVETIAVLQKENQTYQDTLDQVNKKVDELSLARKNFQNLDTSLKSKIQAALPTEARMSSLVRSLESSTLNTQASISALQFQPLLFDQEGQRPDPILEAIPFTFNVEGGFQILQQVLQNLQISQRLLLIEGVNFSKIEGGKTILMSVSGKGYFLK